jgi:hypothetical protein
MPAKSLNHHWLSGLIDGPALGSYAGGWLDGDADGNRLSGGNAAQNATGVVC